MNKLKIIKPTGKEELEYCKNFEQLREHLLCQFEVPGVGRLRTGEKHLNFHLTGSAKTGKKIIEK